MCGCKDSSFLFIVKISSYRFKAKEISLVNRYTRYFWSKSCLKIEHWHRRIHTAKDMYSLSNFFHFHAVPSGSRQTLPVGTPSVGTPPSRHSPLVGTPTLLVGTIPPPFPRSDIKWRSLKWSVRILLECILVYYFVHFWIYPIQTDNSIFYFLFHSTKVIKYHVCNTLKCILCAEIFIFYQKAELEM